jgi:uncharacterized Zn finger protein (UPF0148 family)
MEQKNPSEKRQIGKLWICGIEGCDYPFGRMLTDNTVEIFGSANKLTPRFIINFFRIKVRCPKCGHEWVKQSIMAGKVARELLDEEDRKLGGAPYSEDRLKKVNREMHGAKSAEEINNAFPDREITQEIKLKNRLLSMFMTQERHAYEIMVAESGKGTAGEESLAKAVAAGLGMPLKEGKRLHDVIMEKIRKVRNENLNIEGGEEVGDDNWWQQT